MWANERFGLVAADLSHVTVDPRLLMLLETVQSKIMREFSVESRIKVKKTAGGEVWHPTSVAKPRHVVECRIHRS